jgi:hypothetical protein
MKLRSSLLAALLLMATTASTLAAPPIVQIKMTGKVNASACAIVTREQVKDFSYLFKFLPQQQPLEDMLFQTPVTQFEVRVRCQQETKIAVKITDGNSPMKPIVSRKFVLSTGDEIKAPYTRNDELSSYYGLGIASNGKPFGGYVLQIGGIGVDDYGPEEIQLATSPDGINWQDVHYPVMVIMDGSGSYVSPVSSIGIRGGHFSGRNFTIPIGIAFNFTKVGDLPPINDLQMQGSATVEVEIL